MSLCAQKAAAHHPWPPREYLVSLRAGSLLEEMLGGGGLIVDPKSREALVLLTELVCQGSDHASLSQSCRYGDVHASL